jgi:hypothetical protein
LLHVVIIVIESFDFRLALRCAAATLLPGCLLVCRHLDSCCCLLHPKSSDPGFFEIRNFSDISAANMAMQLWFQREAEAGY